MTRTQTGAPEPTTRTLEVPGATLAYDVRTSETSTEPPLMLIGSPMGRGRIRHAGQPPPGSNGRDVRPARVGAQHEAGHDIRVDAE